MFSSIFLALLNPAIAVIFATVFFLFWKQDRRRRSVAAFALTYLAYAITFALQYFHAPFGGTGNAIVSNVVFVGGLLAFAHGLGDRYGRPAPYGVLAVLGAGAIGCLLWFIFVQPNFGARVLTANFAYGAMLIVLAVQALEGSGTGAADKLLATFLLMAGANCFLRTLVLTWMFGLVVDRQHLLTAPVWVTMNFSSILFAILVATTLIAAHVREVIDDLRRQSMIDALSDLCNRRGFEEGGRALLDHAQRIGAPATLVLGDLDHFKSVNDRFGHVCGDSVIAAFSRCLAMSTGAKDVAGRMGGEEFAVLLGAADLSAGRLFAESTRTACAALSVEELPGDYRITASFGVAQMLPGEDLPSLTRRADAALYQAKRQGRDRVCIAQDTIPSRRATDHLANMRMVQ